MKKLSKKITIITLTFIGVAVIATACIIYFSGPQTTEEYCEQAFWKSNHGKDNEAIKDFDKAIEIEPKNPKGYSARATFLFYLENTKKQSKITVKQLN